MQRHRRWRIVAAVVLAATAVLVLGERWAQKRARQQVTNQLQLLNGGPVEVETVRLRIHGVDITGVRLHELGGQPPVWLTVERVQITIPIWQSLSATPTAKHIVLEEPKINLRFDQAGALQNHLSAISPDYPPSELIEVVNGQLSVAQGGRNTTTARGIDLHIQGHDGKFHAQGVVRELLAAQWKVDADLDIRSLSADIRAATALLPLDATEFNRLPLLPTAILGDLACQGGAAAAIEISFDPEAALEYRLVLEPEAASVSILGAELRQIAGRIELSSDSFTADNVTCSVFGGLAKVDGNLNLTQRPIRGQVSVTASDLALSELSTDWLVSGRVAGKVNGVANLDIGIANGELSASGNGGGSIDQPEVFGVSTGTIDLAVELQRLTHNFEDASTMTNGVVRLELLRDEVLLDTVLSQLSLPGVSLPDKIAGLATVNAHLEVPLESFADSTTHRGKAEVSLAELSIGEALLKDAHFEVAYRDGNADLTSFSATLLEQSRVFGNCKLHSVAGRITGELHLERIPIQSVSDLSGVALTNRAQGAVSGSFRINAPARQWDSPKGWEVDGEISAEMLTLFEHSFTDAMARIRLRDGTLSCQEVAAAWQGIPLRASATVAAEAPYPFVGKVVVEQSDISQFLSAIEAVSIREHAFARLTLHGTHRGQLDPFLFSADGTGQLLDAKVKELELPVTEFKWNINQDKAELRANGVDLLGGQVDVQVDIPLNGRGFSNANAAMHGVNISEAVRFAGELPLELVGKADIDVTVARFEKQDTLTAHCRISGTSARFRDILLDQLVATFGLEDKKAHCRLTGRVLGGQFEFDGAAPRDDIFSNEPKGTGHLVLRDGRLLEIANRMSGRQQMLTRVDGRINAEMDLEIRGRELQTQGQGKITLREVRWDGTEVASRATAEVTLTPTSIQLHGIEATVGNGFVRGELSTRFSTQPTGSARFTAARVDAKRLLVLWPDLAQLVKGTVDARLRADFGAVWTGTGHLSAPRSRVMGVAMALNHVPVEWTFSPSSGRARVNVRASAVRVAGGRVSGKATVEFGETVSVSAVARLNFLRLKSMLAPWREMSVAGDGQVSGTLKLQGRNVRTVNDLRGSFDGDLRNTHALKLPVLRTLNRYLDAGRFGSHNFDSTEVKLRLAKGVIHVDRLSVADDGVQLLVKGKTSVRGRLDLDVTAHVGQFDSQPQLSRLLSSLGVFAQPAAPVALLAQANEFLTNRLIYLHVGGTTRNPTTRLRAGRLLHQEAINFFLREATGGLN